MQFVECAVDAHPGGVLAQVERRADGGERALREETQHDDLAIGGAQFVHHLIEHGP